MIISECDMNNALHALALTLHLVVDKLFKIKFPFIHWFKIFLQFVHQKKKFLNFFIIYIYMANTWNILRK